MLSAIVHGRVDGFDLDPIHFVAVDLAKLSVLGRHAGLLDADVLDSNDEVFLVEAAPRVLVELEDVTSAEIDAWPVAP